MNKARSAYVVVLVFSVLAAIAVPASAQAASITVNQTCIDRGTPETGGGLVSGTFSGAPTGAPYSTSGFVSVDQSADMTPSNTWVHFGGDSVTADAEGNGTFSFNLASYYAALPSPLYVKLRFTDGVWTPFAAVEVPVCPDPEPEPEPIYDFDGFFSPVENRDSAGVLILNKVQAGSTVPLKFRLGGDYGLDVLADGYPKSEAIACNSTVDVNGLDTTDYVGTAGLSYHTGSDTYTYGWKTSKAWEDSCRQLVLKFDDGTVARANFLFKR